MDDKMHYHALQVGELSILKPHLSNYGVSWKKVNIGLKLAYFISIFLKENLFICLEIISQKNITKINIILQMMN